MKSTSLLVLSACPLHAALLAHVATTQGTVTAELQHAKAPQAVANFITLAEGTRSRILATSGAVTDAPLYIGEKFFRVVNDAGFKIAQTGSGTGTNSGGPGFTFKDEFDPALTHVPYVLSMANSGPNSNGSQIFFTGNATIPSLNNVHTVFGLVTDPASRAVIDAIHAAGSNGTTITGITFERTDPAAVAFDELAQNLPSVIKPGGTLTVNRGASATWNLNPPISTGAIFRAFRSTTLNGGWTELTAARQQVGILPDPQVPSVSQALLDAAPTPAAFYQLSVANHPGAVAPSTLANRTVTIPISGAILTYAFNASGNGGTLTFTPTQGSPASGPFITVNPSSGSAASPYSAGAHDIIFDAYAPFLNPAEIWIKIGCDSATSSLVTGHTSSQRWNGSGWSPFATGTATITR